MRNGIHRSKEDDFARVTAINEEMSRLAAEKQALLDRYVLVRAEETLVAVPVEKPGKPLPAPVPVEKPGVAARERGMQPGSFATKIVAFLEAHPERPHTIQEIYDATCQPGKDKKNLRSALFDLWKREKIRQIERGLYQALAGATP